MAGEPQLSVVVAAKDAGEAVDAFVALLPRPALEGVEVLLTIAGPAPSGLDRWPPGVRAIAGPTSSLVPHLWRDGLLAARAQRVAFTTVQFAPPPDWIDSLKRADLEQWVAVGGPIDIGADADAVRWAVFFLRYSAFAPPIAGGEAQEVAADNAVYRRDALTAHADLLAEGFWEPGFHARFRADGLRLALDPALVSTYAGRDRPGRFMAHRFAHGRAYGRERGQAAGWGRRLGLLGTSPAVPLVLLWRIVGRSGRNARYRQALPGALPWLAAFCLAWAAGEARGYLDALTRSRAASRPEG